MNITVIGAGAWGTALAISLAAHHRVTLWSIDADHVEAMRATRLNQRFLPDIPLPENIDLSADLPSALGGAELAIVAVPVAALRSILQQIASRFPLSNSLPQAGERTNEKGNVKFPGVVWVCKGFEAETSLLPHQVAAEALPQEFPRGVLSGPSFAQEVARGLPAALTFASADEEFAQRTAHALHHARLRIYASNDVIGVEVGGAVKNVMAIAAGICDGMGLGHNARAALLTRGIAEISRLGLKLGGRPETLGGLSGAGDLILTCTGDLSRNRQVGLLLAQQHDLSGILNRLGHVAEGVYTVREVHRLAQRLDVAMPICEAVHRILYEQLPAADAVEALLNRAPNTEF
ncbi:NAD(P)H-dependent glycerol-3-phosphate dehydrogenase [Candidatus Ferrigenium straubiae]|jgi:glycerol-3-phosphate dehydrogenase (NAD(P)+)|uniref:NAD(P)H-dependent glycerol-3-phosphate dehydrogenase n=1 Tax=Candidatus Ferrigenium straubiae TaxID=2919506 RepID=UPI003F4AA27A